MINRLLNKTDWDYAALIFKDRDPMAVERKHCAITQIDQTIVIFIPSGVHPFKEPPAKAAAEHHIPIVDIVGITYYTDVRIQTMSNLIN